MKIIALVSENFKRLNAHVVMDGKSVTIEGKNGVGKSSFIDAIWVALTGKDIPAEPIKQGEKSARIEIKVKADDGTQFIVERKFLPSGGTLAVKTAEGHKFASPQKFLDDKIGRISFDPFEFINKPPREQKKFLMDLLGIDLTDIDNNKKALLIQKDELAKQYQMLKAELDKLPAITDELKEKNTTQIIEKFRDANVKKEHIKQLESQKAILETRIKEFSEKLNAIKIEHARVEKELMDFHDSNLDLLSLNDLQAEIAAINEHNEKVKQQQIILNKTAELSIIKAAGQAKSKDIKNLEEARTTMITNAKMPLDGLEFSEDGLTYQGLPFTEEQLSTAKLIEAGIRISMALNPSLRIMRIKDGSLLDSETLNIIKKAAHDNDYQIFIERVSDSKEIGFIIEEN